MYSIDPGIFSRNCQKCESAEQVWSEFVSATTLFGFRQVSYQIVPEMSVDTMKPYIWSNLSPHPWVEKSNRASLYLKSPIVREARRSGRPVYWESVRQSNLSTDDVQLLNERDKSGVSRFGITIPVFGPFRRQGFIGLDLRSSTDRLDEAWLSDIRSLAQTLHLSFCDEAPAPQVHQVRLSNRERAALILLCEGMTKPEIARKLGVAQSTVDTFIRRAYEKLGVRNRVSAVISFLETEGRS